MLDLITATDSDADSLSRLAEVAAAAMSSSVRANVDCAAKLVYGGRNPVSAASSQRAGTFAQLDEDQGEGPITEAIRSGLPISIADLAMDSRWPHYRQRLKAGGCRSILAIPLPLDQGVTGALVFFSSRPDLFSANAIGEATSFAGIASQSLKLALEVRSVRAAADNLGAVLRSRTSIDIACGVIMAQNSCSYPDAFSILAKASSHRNVKVRQVAENILQDLPGGAPRPHFQQ